VTLNKHIPAAAGVAALVMHTKVTWLCLPAGTNQCLDVSGDTFSEGSAIVVSGPVGLNLARLENAGQPTHYRLQQHT
jgi:hypothetical protein